MTRATLNNLVLSAVVGVLVGLSPFTTPRLGLSLAGGLLAGVVFFGYRELERRKTASAEVESAPRFRLPPLSLNLSFVLLLVVFGPTLQWLYAKMTVSIWTNGHGLFAPFIMAYLAHSILSRDEDPQPDSSLWGLPVVTLGVLLAVFDLVPETRYISSFGLVMCLPGLSLLFLGKRRTRLLALPLSLGVFVIPIPDVAGAHAILQDITTTGTLPVLRLLGYPVLRDGTVIMLPTFTMHVSQACSGFSALYAAIFVTVILVAYSDSWVRRAALIALVLPISLLSNIVRVVILALLVQYRGTASLETILHPASGALTFWFVIGMLVLIAGRRALRAVFA